MEAFINPTQLNVHALGSTVGDLSRGFDDLYKIPKSTGYKSGQSGQSDRCISVEEMQCSG